MRGLPPEQGLRPDRWILLRYEDKYCILGGFYGGYTQGDAWRRSTEIVKVELTDNKTYNVTTRSGSGYVLDPELFGTSGLTSQVVLSLEDAHSDKIAAGTLAFVFSQSEAVLVLEGLE